MALPTSALFMTLRCSGRITSPSSREFMATPPLRISPRFFCTLSLPTDRPARHLGPGPAACLRGPGCSARPFLAVGLSISQPPRRLVPVAVRGGTDFDVEVVALLNAGPQHGVHQHQFGRVRRRADFARVIHAAGFASRRSGRTLRRRRRVAAGAWQAGYQTDRIRSGSRSGRTARPDRRQVGRFCSDSRQLRPRGSASGRSGRYTRTTAAGRSREIEICRMKSLRRNAWRGFMPLAPPYDASHAQVAWGPRASPSWGAQYPGRT